MFQSLHAYALSGCFSRSMHMCYPDASVTPCICTIRMLQSLYSPDDKNILKIGASFLPTALCTPSCYGVLYESKCHSLHHLHYIFWIHIRSRYRMWDMYIQCPMSITDVQYPYPTSDTYLSSNDTFKLINIVHIPGLMSESYVYPHKRREISA